MFNFSVTVKKDYHPKGSETRKGSRTIYGKMCVQAETLEAAEAHIQALMMAPNPLQTADPRIEWEEHPDSGKWEYTDYTFEVVDGATEQLDEAEPLTRETLLAWTERRLVLYPIYMCREWDADKQEHVPNAKPNSVQRILAHILLASYNSRQQDDKASELREAAVNLVWGGTKGYKDYTVEEALDEIGEFAWGSEPQWEFATLADLLVEFGPESEFNVDDDWLS